jgi:hypothetical protein
MRPKNHPDKHLVSHLVSNNRHLPWGYFFLEPKDFLFYSLLVWTPCLMHRCVCIWRYILQNYNYKLHFHVSIGTLAAENLDVCTACDPWDINIQLTMGKDQRQQIYVGFVVDIDIKILGMPPRGRACLSQTHAHWGGGGNLFLPGFSSLYDAIHGWMTGRMDGWKASRKMTTTSFTICNNTHD